MAFLLLVLDFLAHSVGGFERAPLPDLLLPWRLPAFEECADDSDLLLCHVHGLPSICSGWSWKELLMLFCIVFSIAKMDLDRFLHKMHIRPNLMLAGWPTMIGFIVFISTM